MARRCGLMGKQIASSMAIPERRKDHHRIGWSCPSLGPRSDFGFAKGIPTSQALAHLVGSGPDFCRNRCPQNSSLESGAHREARAWETGRRCAANPVSHQHTGRRPIDPREEPLFSDHVITIAGRSITITSHEVFMTGVSVVIGLVFWAALYFSRKQIVVLKRSNGTDQLALQLSRIADALERIANRPADRAIASAMRRQAQAQPPPQREPQGIAYSMFGR